VTEAQDNSDPDGTTDTTPSRKDSAQTGQIVQPS
jgi:hypothetical protein